MASVLIVDDEHSIRTTLVAFLNAAGHHAEAAASAEEARALLDAHPTDVVLLDVLLGMSNGLDVARYIRDRQPTVRTILMTGEPNFASACQSIRLRVFDYLVKPVSRQDVLSVVGHAAAAKARDDEYALLLRERERSQEELENRVMLRTAELNESTANLHALAARLQVVREEERAALARELHDEFGQNLTALQIDLDWIDRHLRAYHPSVSIGVLDRIATMSPLVERLTVLTQTVCSSLRPGLLDDLGLLAAIEWQAEDYEKRTGLRCVVSLPPQDPAMRGDQALALFRIFQEGLTNVVRHAQATHAEIRLNVADGDVELAVQDNGRGFAPELIPTSQALGLLSMRERAAGFNGSVSILSAPGGGTTVRVRMPIAPTPPSP
jgi:signal transduction histidine kinase